MKQNFERLLAGLPQFPGWLWVLVYFIIIGSFSEFMPNILLVPSAIALAIGFKQVKRKQKLLAGQAMAKRIQNLKDTVNLADKQSQLMNRYLLENDMQNFQLVAQQLLPKIQFIKEESYQLKGAISPQVYQRINHKADEVKVDAVLQLEQMQIDHKLSASILTEKVISEKAPEIQEIYQNVQKDNKSILEKIATADNKAELEALQESSMQHFNDILNGYLKIKASPKDYYNAEERLTSAHQALQDFDLDLDETLRKLNESELKDFDVSLRMMQKQNQMRKQEELEE
ncbi:hypothetical protein AT575_08100 [Streptococcus penaeicida]|uniref:5-bromo-4-chloroindolyl phosphate hydrolysis protein n=1 Tax=Streptococcus penaeicida TaxID=1765960 RepID=A0A2N8LAU7_9STRE|nr:hypothetical protein [Streptococcus penaeicida]PND47281.1 hypothetical protein AT575_08100 [Streptococcus penaeicida]